MKRNYSGCPSEDCRAANPRQVQLTDKQLARIIDGMPKNLPTNALSRCAYCGCVYYYDLNGVATKINRLDN